MQGARIQAWSSGGLTATGSWPSAGKHGAETPAAWKRHVWWLGSASRIAGGFGVGERRATTERCGAGARPQLRPQAPSVRDAAPRSPRGCRRGSGPGRTGRQLAPVLVGVLPDLGDSDATPEVRRSRTCGCRAGVTVRFGISPASASPPPTRNSESCYPRASPMASPGAAFSAALAAEDFPLVEGQEGMGMAPDKYREVFDLAQRGTRAFRDRRFDEVRLELIPSSTLLPVRGGVSVCRAGAISFYSKALNLRPGDPIILSNRSLAFCRISQLLRGRSAADSEYQPLNGLDPTTHAELALKDAEKIISINSNSPRPYLLKAYALILLEHYHEAREALLAGLQVDPLSHVLQTCLSDLDRNTNIAAGARRASVTLSNIIQRNFPEEYAERRSEHETMTYAGVDLMPLFVMDVVLPCQKMALNIFEPRYRLMVRRIMEGNHRMGMVAIDSTTGTVADCGCEVEILECEPLPDGRFYLEVEGSRRFRILRSWDQDGYRVAEVEWLQDIPLPEGSQERRELIELANGASELARAYIRRARETVRTARRTRHLDLESMPGPQDPEKFSFWLADLISLRPSDRLDLLRLRDTREVKDQTGGMVLGSFGLYTVQSIDVFVKGD
ncbi:hypothetical protein C2845_PM02G22760 [Panicum miliaceum]|uniref:Lon N-terminal domain-containing protein n=1 Tax=Panicum miliaceum TaxID=4540 RepID=A0A3L6SC91_PANMI|nr:hypothetical protein C2845_PM02G22760 [Panicum miliaceum]